MEKSNNNKATVTPNRSLSSSLKGFEIDAIRACRGLQVSMAIHVFGVGKVLPNTLPTPADKLSSDAGI